MALDHSCQVQQRPLSERGLVLYETPAIAVEALLRVESKFILRCGNIELERESGRSSSSWLSFSVSPLGTIGPTV
jgi:hypothetical protein